MKRADAKIQANPVYDLGGAPVNITAANALKGGYTHDVRLDPWDSVAPIPTGQPMPGTPDMLGIQFGRFRVVGHTGKKAPRRGTSMWVVRCSCGTYSVRKTTAIRNPSNSKDACGRCRHISQIKARYVYLKTGRNVQAEDFR